ncbi:bystin [Gastrolobium bilobum]|uniref:bystin n=1 Tax=Gastrolobium bilobum TaxID=150636 RepID=UPI002AAF3091|nr:bystin [Gastrolobium bilobum]
MGKKRKERIQNPEPFLLDATEFVKSRKRSKAPRQHQKKGKLIDGSISSKIMKEALIQQKEEEAEENQNANSSFQGIEEPTNFEEGDDDIDDFAGFSETQSHFNGHEEEINEDDERLIEAFLAKEQGGQKTLADLIVERIKEKDASVDASVVSDRPVLEVGKPVIDYYKRVGLYLSRYESGKLPKAFKHITSLLPWEEVLNATEPQNWSPNAMYQATRFFASNFGVRKAERFYRFVLLPRVREDIRKNKRLHFALYQSLKKALYKPAAFFEGILLALCESRTCTCREAVIIGSIIEKVSIPQHYSGAALVMLAEMEYCGSTSYFIKLLLEKKYALDYDAVDAVVAHFMRFHNETRIMPVIWHQSLLAFVQGYKNELQKEDKDNLRFLLDKQHHKLVTPEIIRELNHSRNRGEKEEEFISISSSASVIIKTIEEDRFDIPGVPMEED